MTEHRTSVSSCRFGDDEYGYRAVCSCGWKGRAVGLDIREAAEWDADQHANYHAEVARLHTTAPRTGGRGEGER